MTDASALLATGLAQMRRRLRANYPPTISREEIPPFADDGTQEIASSLWTGEWAKMRFVAAEAARTESADWRLPVLAQLLFNDPVHRDLCRRRADTFADQLEDGGCDRAGQALPDFTAMGLLLPAGPADFIASKLLDDASTLDWRVVRMLILATSDPTSRLTGMRILLSRLDSMATEKPSPREELGALLSEPDPEGAVGEALLAAQAQTTAGHELLMDLTSDRIERTGWVPAVAPFTAMYARVLESAVAHHPDMWRAVAPQDRLPVFLRGAARTVVENDCGLTAALLSLSQLRIGPDIEALGRGIFESARVSAWSLLKEILEVALWPGGRVTPDEADYFHLSILGALQGLAERDDHATVRQLIALGRACLESLDGDAGPRSREFVQRADSWDSGRRESFPGTIELADNVLLAEGIWGTETPEIFQSTVASHLQLESDGVSTRLDASSVLELAAATSLRRRRGPAAMLLLVDVALESGDLRQARAALDEVSRRYPRHSIVLEWQIKVDLAAGNARLAAKRLGALRELWQMGIDDASPFAQVNSLERLVRLSWAKEVALERAGRIRSLPEFAALADRIERVLGK
jgi:hypothetical protein